MTQLRRDLFKVTDYVLKTGESIEIMRRGKKLVLTTCESRPSKLSRLKRRHGLKGNPEDFVTLPVGQWTELKNLQ